MTETLEQEITFTAAFEEEPGIEEIRMHLCDSCGTVRAKAMLVKDSSVFTMCGHHLRRYTPTLMGLGFNVIDPMNELSFGNLENRLQGADHS